MLDITTGTLEIGADLLGISEADHLWIFYGRKHQMRVPRGVLATRARELHLVATLYTSTVFPVHACSDRQKWIRGRFTHNTVKKEMLPKLNI